MLFYYVKCLVLLKLEITFWIFFYFITLIFLFSYRNQNKFFLDNITDFQSKFKESRLLKLQTSHYNFNYFFTIDMAETYDVGMLN